VERRDQGAARVQASGNVGEPSTRPPTTRAAWADAAVKLFLDATAFMEASVRQIQYARKRFSRDAFRCSFLGAIGDQTSIAPSTQASRFLITYKS
jgi:hypothetical protein